MVERAVQGKVNKRIGELCLLGQVLLQYCECERLYMIYDLSFPIPSEPSRRGRQPHHRKALVHIFAADSIHSAGSLLQALDIG